jgi:hypothetical protein
MRKIIGIFKKIWIDRVPILKVLVFLVVGCYFFDSFISMFYLWPSEGLFNEPPYWLTNALIFIASRLFEVIKNVVVMYPGSVLAIVLFLLAPFYKRLIKYIEKIWHDIEVEIVKLRRMRVT